MYVHLKPLGCHWQCIMLECFGCSLAKVWASSCTMALCRGSITGCFGVCGGAGLAGSSLVPAVSEHGATLCGLSAADCPLPVLLLSFANSPTLPSQLPIVGGWPYNRKRKNKPTETDLSCNASLKWCATLHSGTVWLLSLEQQKNSMMHSILNDLLLRSFKLDAQLHVWRCYHSSGKI